VTASAAFNAQLVLVCSCNFLHLTAYYVFWHLFYVCCTEHWASIRASEEWSEPPQQRAFPVRLVAHPVFSSRQVSQGAHVLLFYAYVLRRVFLCAQQPVRLVAHPAFSSRQVSQGAQHAHVNTCAAV
jgi:hypothetical protein